MGVSVFVAVLVVLAVALVFMGVKTVPPGSSRSPLRRRDRARPRRKPRGSEV